MSNQQMIEVLRKIITPYVQDQEAFEKLSEDTNFIDDLKINSANLVDVILDVEDEFDIEIEDDQMENMLTVESAINIIKQKIAAK